MYIPSITHNKHLTHIHWWCRWHTVIHIEYRNLCTRGDNIRKDNIIRYQSRDVIISLGFRIVSTWSELSTGFSELTVMKIQLSVRDWKKEDISINSLIVTCFRHGIADCSFTVKQQPPTHSMLFSVCFIHAQIIKIYNYGLLSRWTSIIVK
jgi:hypothetical protein